MAPYNPLLPQTPQIPLVGITADPTKQQNPDLNWSVPLLGRHGELQASQVHGPGFISAARGNRYIGNGATTTGVEILAPGGTTSGFVFGNPASSGVVMEVHRMRVVPIGATIVVAALGLEFGATPVSTTYQVANGMPIGAPMTAKCKCWDAVTIVANTWLRALPIFIPATTDVDLAGYEFPFEGFVIAAGFAVNLVSTITQGTIKFLVDVEWSEWPV